MQDVQSKLHYNIARSCNQKFQEDPIKDPSLNESQQQKPRPKSFKEEFDDNQWSTPLKEEITRSPKKVKQDKQVQNKKINLNRNDKQFAEEIIDSEEVSVEDSRSQNGSSKEHKEETQKLPILSQATTKKTYFNLMLLGSASTGKTSYAQCFSKQYKQKNDPQLIKPHTTGITQIQTQPNVKDINLQFHIIDTPGYSHTTIDKYSKMVQQQIKNRIDSYRENVKKCMTESSVYMKQQREIRDERIHCCLFFFRGPRFHSDDWRLMSQLYDKCNIIPVIAKGDTYTIPELLQLKHTITSTAKSMNIHWFDIQEYMRQKHPTHLNLVTKGIYGPSPPFMIACSITQVQNRNGLVLGREYKWGTCVVEDEQHTEFGLLNRLLIWFLRDGFINMTTIKQEEHRKKIQGGRKWKKPNIFQISIAVVVVGMISLTFFKTQVGKN